MGHGPKHLRKQLCVLQESKRFVKTAGIGRGSDKNR